jgi:hypothetical protein
MQKGRKSDYKFAVKKLVEGISSEGSQGLAKSRKKDNPI